MHRVHIYTGDGKGKTTAAFGLALRARGRDLRVAVVQFLKRGDFGEVIAALRLGIEVEQFGTGGFVDPTAPPEEDRRLAAAAWTRLVELCDTTKLDLLIADELLVAVDLGLVDLAAVCELIDSRPAVELVLTGRNAHPELVRRADLVSEVLALKHYYDEGLPARRGIEY
ncbi:MAG: cob(I)yrinic acid a,c-diamide adenosyltransferase [Candidatus Coatesbacteria bacterium]|nr:cob(I)yrinic acid a,c-diamide adenosyltransferase [Candidatus Coatesbacteria bacterium]